MINYQVRPGRSGIAGTGVFAGTKIPRRVKIGEVTGDLISVRAARIRAAGQRRICLVDVSDTFTLDCTNGNVLRHLNHSCDSNAYLRISRHRVEVYARKDIRKGEEITVDYGESPHSGGMRCLCGKRHCRGKI